VKHFNITKKDLRYLNETAAVWVQHSKSVTMLISTTAAITLHVGDPLAQ